MWRKSPEELTDVMDHPQMSLFIFYVNFEMRSFFTMSNDENRRGSRKIPDPSDIRSESSKVASCDRIWECAFISRW